MSEYLEPKNPKPKYITLTWNTPPPLSKKRVDYFSISSKNQATVSRGSYRPGTKVLNVNVDMIWKDTLDFDKFVKGLSVIYLTEFSCFTYHGGEKINEFFLMNNLYCYKHHKRANQCVFFRTARAICNSDYYLKSPSELKMEDNDKN